MDLGLTQTALADRLGCSTRTLILWELDHVEPKACQWPKLRAVLGDGIDPIGIGFPSQLRAARLRLGLTQKQLAYVAGVHERTVRNAELERFPPSRKPMAKLRSALDLPEDLLPAAQEE